MVPVYPVTVNSAPPQQEAGTAPAPSGPVCGPEATAKARLTVHGVHARTSGRFDGMIARFAYTDHRATAANFRVEIRWGNGHTSRGKIAGSGGSFQVIGVQRFTQARHYRPQITVTAPDGAQATAHSEITVVHRHEHRHSPSRPPRDSARNLGFTA